MYERKINVSKQTKIPHHNGGWNFVLKILNEFHSDEGTYVDDIADITFGSNYENNIFNKVIPYKHPWIGFFHHPVNIAPWYSKSFMLKPIVMISSDEFRTSNRMCRGIFTFSKSMTNWYKNNLPEIRIEHLWHPTLRPKKVFDKGLFLSNSHPQIIHIGFFLRKLTTIFFLDCDKYEKIILVNPQVYNYLHQEISYFKYNLDFSKIKFKSYVSNDEYEDILSRNIVFLDLYDSCANNIIIECIARNTPILVNKQEAVIEYLGKKYPLYYRNIKEASSKLADKSLIIETHNYLRELITKKYITGEYFAASLYNSSIYRSL